MTLTAKFKKDVQTLRGAANGDFYLDVKNPKLYKKVRRYYENEGVVFSGDPLDDYEMLMEYVLSDLETVEVQFVTVFLLADSYSRSAVLPSTNLYIVYRVYYLNL